MLMVPGEAHMAGRWIGSRLPGDRATTGAPTMRSLHHVRVARMLYSAAAAAANVLAAPTVLLCAAGRRDRSTDRPYALPGTISIPTLVFAKCSNTPRAA